MTEPADADLRITVLGCGSSGGVPRIGGDWGACDPDDPRNRRTRCGLLVEKSATPGVWAAETTTVILIDTPTDLRAQLLREGVGRVDAVVYSHDHADQTHGIDDLRVLALRAGARVPVHMDARTAEILTARFAYCFVAPEGALYPPILTAHQDLTPGAPLTIDGPGGPATLTPLDQEHGPIRSLGFRIGSAAYCNDVHALPEASFAALAGVESWILDALRWSPHVSHANVDTALKWIARVGPKRAWLTNLHIDLDYGALDGATPAHVTPAHDGLRVYGTTA